MTSYGNKQNCKVSFNETDVKCEMIFVIMYLENLEKNVLI